jgi:hypothetical protein
MTPKEANLIAEINKINRVFKEDVSLAEIFNTESEELVDSNELTKTQSEPIGFRSGK